MKLKHIFITTYNKSLYDSYAKQLIETYQQTNQQIPLYVFAEDDIDLYENYKNVNYYNLHKLERELETFVQRNKSKPVKGFLENAVKFSYKVFAQSAARQFAEKIYYVDSDSVFIKQIPMEWFEECLPDGTFLSFYDRTHQYTETGFLAFNSENDICNSFFEIYKGYYIYDTVYQICKSNFLGTPKELFHSKGNNFWTDCHTLDETREAFKNNKQYVEKKLGDGGQGHIMARDNFIHPYIDHRKVKRKKKENSPEWIKNKR